MSEVESTMKMKIENVLNQFISSDKGMDELSGSLNKIEKLQN